MPGANHHKTEVKPGRFNTRSQIISFPQNFAHGVCYWLNCYDVNEHYQVVL